MDRARIGDAHEVVDLASDSEDELISEDEIDFFEARAKRNNAKEDSRELHEFDAHYSPFYEVPDRVIDLTGIPDIDVPPSNPASVHSDAGEYDSLDNSSRLVTEAIGLQMILDFLPDISIDHVLNLLREKTTDLTRSAAQCQGIIMQLVEDGDYPKESDEASKRKRKRDDRDEWEEYDKVDRDLEVPNYESDATDLLKDEFLLVPVRHITNVLKQHITLYKSYLVLEEQVRNYGRIANGRFSKIGKPRITRGAELILIERGSQVPKELHAAKKKVEGEMAKRRKAVESKQAEEDNRKEAERTKQMGECACCFDDVPLNRMIFCNGDTTHSYCLECPKRQIETQMGQSKCWTTCFGVDDCEGTFQRKDLQRVLGDRTFERLEHMQQQQDLAAAGLDFLSECPFCDFKMECLPVEIDREFRCQSKKCAKTSCRLCDKETHIPLTCKEAEKDGQLTLRHIVEEAMSAALIRQCNQCKHPFVKDHGCNKMTCSHCRNVQCYVCSKNVTNYDHFGEVGRGRCPLHENVEDRHEQEVKKAADEAMAKVRADNPELSDADLMIKVSDRVKQAEDARKGQAQAQANAFPYHMVDDQLQHRHRVAPPPPPPIIPDQHRPVPIDPPIAQYVPVYPYAVHPVPVLAQPLHYLQPPPFYAALGLAPQQPQQPAGFGLNMMFPVHHFVHEPPAVHPAAPQQAPPPQARAVPLDAVNLNQRLDQERQLQQQQVQQQLQMQMRLQIQQRFQMQEQLQTQHQLQVQQQLQAQQQLQRQQQRLRLIQHQQQHMARQYAILQQDRTPLRQSIEDPNARIRDMEHLGEAKNAQLRRNPQ